MTSLAQQLKRLAVPHTQAVLGEDKRRVSLLFDPREAANLDREAVFAIGQSGLEELENVNEKFIEFEESLFSITSQNWERSLQTKEVNEQLDELIKEFLVLLSPYFPLKSAHKSLEWLIYRYHIHHFNKDDLLLCILPYHEMRIFVRVIQLLKLNNPADKWNWLESSAKNGVPLAKSTLINHCTKDPGFMAFILDTVPTFIKVHGPDSPQLHAILAFFTSTMLGSLQNKDDISEKMLSVVIPHIIKGLKSKCTEYRAANFMILSQLVVQVPLKEDLLLSLLPVLTKKLSNQLTQEGLACLALVYQTQHLCSMPKKTFKHVCRVPGIMLLLTKLSSQYNVDALLKAWLQRLIPAAIKSADSVACGSSSDASEDMVSGKPNYTMLLQGVLNEVKFASTDLYIDTVRTTIMSLIQRRLEMMDNSEMLEDWNTLTKSLLCSVERRHGSLFDTVLEKVMSEVENDGPSLSVLQEMMTLTNTPLKYQLLPDVSTSLFLGLKHHSVHTRLLALGHVTKIARDVKSGTIDFLGPLLMERLEDDNPEVVMAVLQLQSYLMKIVDQSKLIPVLFDVVKRSINKENWLQVCKACLELLCTVCDDEHTWLFLPYLVVLHDNEQNINIAKVIMDHSPGQVAELVKTIRTEWLQLCAQANKDHSDLSIMLNTLLFDGIVQAIQSLDTEECQAKIRNLLDHCGDHSVYIFLVVNCLSRLVLNVSGQVKVTVMENLLNLAKFILNLTENSKLTKDLSAYNSESLLPTWLAFLRKKSSGLPPSLAVWSLCCLVDSLAGEQIDDGSSHFIKEYSRASPVIHLLDFLMIKTSSSESEVWRTLVIKLVLSVLPLDTMLKIICFIWMWAGHRQTPIKISVDLHLGSFYIFGRLLDQSKDKDKFLDLMIMEPTLVCLILSLCHPEDCVSSVVMMLNKVKDHFEGSLGSCCLLIKRLTKKPHIPDIVFMKMFNTLMDDGTAPRKVTEKDLEVFTKWLIIDETPTQMKANLLEIMRRIHPQLLLDSLLPLAINIIQKSSSIGVTDEDGQMKLLKVILERLFDANELPDDRCTDVIFAALKTRNKHSDFEGPQEVALQCVNAKLFSKLKDLEKQKKLVSVLLDIGEKTLSSEMSAKLRSCMRKLHLRGCHVLHELQVKDESEVKTVKGKKRSRISLSVKPLNYPRLTLLLEVIEARKKIKDKEELAQALFSLLRRLLQDDHEDTEFCKQMTLSCLHNICLSWNEDTKPQNQDLLSLEDVVQCIRNSPSPQTQQQAMMLMTVVAPLYPEYILHHVMSIFTFMGNCLLQQDDAYSFQLITKTLDTVIPALIKACASKSESDSCESSLIEDILRVFVDARHHIPKHRCLVLFRKLTEQVGVNSYLWTIIVLQIENAIRTKDVPVAMDTVIDIMEEGRTSIDKDIEFICTMVQSFDARVQLHSLSEVVHFLTQLCYHLLKQQELSSGTQQAKKSKKAPKVPVIALQSLTPQHLRLIEYHGTRLVVRLLGTDSFVNGIQNCCSENAIPDDIIELFQVFMQQCLSLVTLVAKGHGVHGNTNKFWRALLAKVYDILDKVNMLLPNSVFLSVVSSLLDCQTFVIQKKALELLNSKTQQLALEHFDEAEVKALADIVPRLLDIAKSVPHSDDRQADYTTLRQLALFSLKIICKLLGPSQPKKFLKLFTVCLDIITSAREPAPVISSALLCIAELCTSLKAQALPYLPKFMPSVMSLLKDTDMLQRSELLLVCCFTVIQKTVSSLPHFLSPYLQDILLSVCQIATFLDLSDSNKKSQTVIRLKALRHQLATAILPRVLVPALSQSLGVMIKLNQKGLTTLFDITKEHVQSMEKEDLTAQHSALVNFYCQSLDLRNIDLQITYEEMEEVEDVAIEAVVAMVMKLSENSFRPMFYKLYDWACREEDIVFKNRRLTFFKLAGRLSDRLKSLFNLFIGHAIKAACDILNQNNTKNGDVTYYGSDDMATRKSNQLLKYTIGCLHKCFLHDTEVFVNKEMFEILLNPLVDQLENMIGGELAYQERVMNHVMPCISQLALAIRDELCWKSLNYQVLLKTRHNSAKVRFATLHVVEDLASKLGDEYMTLLPETVPFLAELMEDDSEEVEQKCQQVVSSLETVLGESIQQYF